MKILAFILGAGLAGTALASAQDQTTTTSTTTTTTSVAMAGTSARDAVGVAKDGVDASIRDNIVSIYGVGNPAGIQTWWVIFYDPSTASHGRAVKVSNGQIVRTYAANGGVTYGDTLTFPRSQVTGEGAALTAAQNYADQHAIHFNQVRVLLRVTQQSQTLRWRVQLLNHSHSRGFVFVNAADGSFAMYAPPGSVHTSSSSNTGGVVGDAERAGDDVKNTFLGVGGDLQQFFTGERTVDQ